jgi:hypothetical protein
MLEDFFAIRWREATQIEVNYDFNILATAYSLFI